MNGFIGTPKNPFTSVSKKDTLALWLDCRLVILVLRVKKVSRRDRRSWNCARMTPSRNRWM